MMRQDNLRPFAGKDDYSWIDYLKDELRQAVELVLAEYRISCDVGRSRLRKVECNITRRVAGRCTCAWVCDLINKVCYDTKNIAYQSASVKCRYLKTTETLRVRVPNYYLIEIYNKSLAERVAGNGGVEDGLLRVEVIFLDRSIKKVFGSKCTFDDVFSRRGFRSVVDAYVDVFSRHLKERLAPGIEEIVKILATELIKTNSIVAVLARYRELVVDTEVLWLALIDYYLHMGYTDERARNNASARISRQSRYELPRDVLKTLKEFEKDC